MVSKPYKKKSLFVKTTEDIKMSVQMYGIHVSVTRFFWETAPLWAAELQKQLGSVTRFAKMSYLMWKYLPVFCSEFVYVLWCNATKSHTTLFLIEPHVLVFFSCWIFQNCKCKHNKPAVIIRLIQGLCIDTLINSLKHDSMTSHTGTFPDYIIIYAARP